MIRRSGRSGKQELDRDLKRAGVTEENWYQARAVFWCMVIGGILVIVGVIINALS